MDEEAWAPMKPFVRWLSARRIAQIWLHHANDIGKSFGTKTREWEMDTVIFLSHPADEGGGVDDTAIKLEFRKARLRTPQNADQFLPLVIRPGDDWRFEVAPQRTVGKCDEVQILKREIMNAYDRLADGKEKTAGFDGKPVLKMSADAIRDEVRNRGFLDTDKKGAISSTSRSHYRKAKNELLAKAKLVEAGGLIWRP